MGRKEKKLSFYSYVLARLGFFIMAVAIAYPFIFDGARLKLIKFPLIGGEVQFYNPEKLPKDVIKVALNEAKYIFDDKFILKVRPDHDQSNNYFDVSFYKITHNKDLSPYDISKNNRAMTPGNFLTIQEDNTYYNVRMNRILKENDAVFCYFRIYTTKEAERF